MQAPDHEYKVLNPKPKPKAALALLMPAAREEPRGQGGAPRRARPGVEVLCPCVGCSRAPPPRL